MSRILVELEAKARGLQVLNLSEKVCDLNKLSQNGKKEKSNDWSGIVIQCKDSGFNKSYWNQ